MSDRILYSIVVPCWNERDALAGFAVELERVFGARDDIEFVFVDNGSEDGSWDALAALCEGASVRCRRVRLERNMGYGGGIMSGLERCEGAYLGWTHADGQVPLECVRDALERIPLGESVHVKGQRRSGRTRRERALSWCHGVCASVLLGGRFDEVNAPPNLLSRELVEGWERPPLDHQFEVHALWHSVRAGARIERVPVPWRAREHGASSWNHSLLAPLRLGIASASYMASLRRR